MITCTCVYLHGFLSSQNSQKGRWFKDNLPRLIEAEGLNIECRVLTPNYPMANPHESVDYLEHFIKQAGLLNLDRHHPWFLAGSSLGGFYAQYLAHVFNKPYLMINPALDPIGLFSEYVGEHINPHTEETIRIDTQYSIDLKEYYQHPSQNLASLLLLDRGDEIIPYSLAEGLYSIKPKHHKTMLFEGGDHAFQHLNGSKKAIKQFVYELILKDLEKEKTGLE